MKKLLTGVAAVATLIAGPALADPNDNQTITINGTSPNVERCLNCQLSVLPSRKIVTVCR